MGRNRFGKVLLAMGTYKKVVLTSGVLSLLLCGCQKTDVDYELDTQSVQRTQGNSIQETSPLELESVNAWEEDIQVTENVEFHINASITIPDVEQMSVVELQKTEFEEAYKKKVIEYFFGTSQVYSNEPENWTKSRLQEQIDDLEKTIQSIEDVLQEAENNPESNADIEGFKQMMKEYKEEQAGYQEQIKQAKDEFVEIEDYSGANYVGTYNAKNYTLSFDDTRDCSFVLFSVDDIADVGSEEADSLWSYFAADSEWIKGAKNHCELTEEEGRKQAEEALLAIGWSEPIWKDTEFLVWSDENGEEVVDGYCFTASLGIGNMAFGDFDSGYEWVLGQSSADPYQGTADIYINDNGIVYMSVNEPVNVVQITENVSLLSLDTIKGIIRNELSNHPEKYLEDGKKTYFTQLELNYIRIKDDSRERYFSYVPVWRLCHKTGSTDNGMGRKISGYPVLVNAIDGSVIDIKDIVE